MLRCFKSIRLIATLCVLSWVASSAMAASSAQEALQLLNAGEDRKAAKLCKQTRGLDERDAQLCLVVSAIAHNNSKDYKSSERAARKLVARAKGPQTLAAGHRELGNALLGQIKASTTRWPLIEPSKKVLTKLGEAEVALRRAIELDPEGQGAAAAQIGLASALTAQMLYAKDWSVEEEIREILFEFLETATEGSPSAEWARSVTCTSDRYRALKWDPRAPTASEVQHSEEDWERILDCFLFRDGVCGGDVQRPVKLRTKSPQYAFLARLARLEGQVIVQAVIDKQGNVAFMQPIKRLPLCLTEEAALALQDWKFEPATLDGEPVDVYYNLTVNFKLQQRR